MSGKTILRTIYLSAGAVIIASEAMAFNCSLPEGPDAPYSLYEKPSDKSKVLAIMPAGGRIRLPKEIRDKGGFTYVIWVPADPKIKRRLGWVDRLKTHGGECED